MAYRRRPAATGPGSPFDYLGYLMSALDVPLVFVPGNHDHDLSGYRSSRAGLTMRSGLPARPPWPSGASNADGRVVDVAGLRVAGLGGCLRYSGGPNQYSDRQQARRARALRATAWWHRRRDGHGVDGLLTHAPPLGVGDGTDLAHRGFSSYRSLVAALQPAVLLHGHVHPSCPMTFSTRLRVASLTFAAPLITRETVPTPTPDVSATSAMVTRPERRIPASPVWNRFQMEPVPSGNIYHSLNQMNQHRQDRPSVQLRPVGHFGNSFSRLLLSRQQ